MNTTKENIKINEEVDVPVDLPKEVVVIPIVNSPIFPGMIAPIILTEDKYTAELDAEVQKTGYVALNLVKFKEGHPLHEDTDFDEEIEYEDFEAEQTAAFQDLTAHDVYKVGVLCKVVKKLKLPDGSVNLLVHGLKRFRVEDFLQEKPFW
jgi:ATP-dependent Lon protease